MDQSTLLAPDTATLRRLLEQVFTLRPDADAFAINYAICLGWEARGHAGGRA